MFTTCPQKKYAPSFWKYDGYYPLIWFKRIECKDCGATVPTLVMTIDDAIDYWNAIKDDETGEGYVLQRLKSEDFEVQ